MATITAGVRDALITIYIGMFKAAPGRDALSDMVAKYESGLTQKEIAAELAADAAFKAEYPDLQLPEEFAAELVDWLAGEATAAGKEWSTNWVIAQLNAGKSKATIIVEAVNALRAATNTGDFGDAQDNLNNKLEVARYYAVEKQVAASSELVIANVNSDPASVAGGKEFADGSVTGETFVLTTGVDNFVGGRGVDTFIADSNSAGASTLTALDKLDGGEGRDILNLTDVNAVSIPTSATVKNIEVANITSAGAVNGDVSGWSGLETVTVVSNTSGAGATQDLVVGDASLTWTSADSAAAAATTGALTVTGGSEVTISRAITNTGAVNTTATGGQITVTGTADTTSVSVTQSKTVAASATVKGITAGVVAINDANASSTTKAGTITEVSLANYGNSTINSNALTTVNLSGTAGTLGITNALGAVKALDINVNGLSGANTIDDVSNKYTTLNVKSTGAASTIAGLNSTSVTALNVSGDKALTLTSIAGLAAVTKIDATASTGGVKIDSALLTNTVFTGGEGADTITVGLTTKAISTGGGNDKVTLTGAALGADGTVDAGAGTDTLAVSHANAITATAGTAVANFSGKVTGFEVLEINAASAATGEIKVANLNNAGWNAINSVVFAAAVGHATTVSGLASGASVTFKAANAATTTVAIKDADVNTADVLNVTISNVAGIDVKTIVAADVETVNFTTDDTAVVANNISHEATLTAAAAKTITVSGDAGLDLTYTGTTLTSFDASGVTAGAVNWTTGNLAEAATIKGGAGANTINFSTATKAVTYTGGAGVDTVTANNSSDNVINTGDGDDVVTLGSGKNTVDLGAGDDEITLGSGLSVVTLGAGADVVIAALATNGNTYTTITDFGAEDVIDFDSVANGDIVDGALGDMITLGSTAAFADFLNAAAAGDGSTDSLVTWFQYGGDTYVVLDNDAAVTYENGIDTIIKLSGLVDLSTAEIDDNELAFVA